MTRALRLVLLVGAAVAAGCHTGDEQSAQDTLVAPVTLVAAVPHHFVETVEGSGAIAPLPEAVTVMAPLYPGRIAGLPTPVGTRVRAGAAVCEIVLDPLAAAEIDKLRQAAVQADRMLARQRVALAAGVSPRVALEQAEIDASNARAELAARTQDYDLVTHHQTLRAPADGMVAALGAHIGQQVDTSTAVVTLVDPDRLAADVRFDAAAAQRVTTGQPATITPLEDQTHPLRTVVLRAARLLDPTSQRAEIWLQSVGNLPLGSFVHATVEVDTRESLAVPRSALVKTDTGYRVFVVADGLAHARAVEVGIVTDEHAEIRTGVGAGEMVASAGGQELADGMRVAAGPAQP